MLLLIEPYRVMSVMQAFLRTLQNGIENIVPAGHISLAFRKEHTGSTQRLRKDDKKLNKTQSNQEKAIQ